MRLSKGMKDSYLADGGVNCPHCGAYVSGTAAKPGWGHRHEVVDSRRVNVWTCRECGGGWYDGRIDRDLGPDLVGEM